MAIGKSTTYKGKKYNLSDRERAIVDLAQESSLTFDKAVSFTGALTAGTGIEATTGGITVTAGGLTITAGQTATRGTILTQYQPAEATTDDGTAVVSAANILTGIVKCTPGADRSKATDTATNLVASLGLSVNDDSFDFSLVNLATDGSSHITLTAGTGVTLVGCMVISAQDLAEDAFTSGVARFRIRRTGATAVTMFRIS